jgi:hypothetical protein
MIHMKAEYKGAEGEARSRELRHSRVKAGILRVLAVDGSPAKFYR